jgi:hypothetical protein
MIAFSRAQGRPPGNRVRRVGAAGGVLLTAVLASAAWVNHQSSATAIDRDSPAPARTQTAAPAMEACRRAIAQHRFEQAIHEVDLALSCDPGHVEALLLRGQLLILRKDFRGARVALLGYLRQRFRQEQAADDEAQHLYELCKRPRAGDINNLLAIAAVFERQKMPDLAEGLLTRHGGFSLAVQQRLREIQRRP